MTISNAARYVQNLWDWSCLDGCFDNPRVSVTDLDGALEKNGYLLILETKKESADLSVGQRIAFRNLCRTGHTSIIVVWGDPQRPVAYQVYHDGHIHDRQPCNSFLLRQLVSRWYRWASDQPVAWVKTRTQREPRISHTERQGK